MRRNITKKNFTKPERIFVEILKELHIPFEAKVKFIDREIDFVIGIYAVEIDGHGQDPDKNNLIVSAGYIPVHIANDELYNNKEIIKLWLNQIKPQLK